MSERFSVTASALGSYFGVGFLSPYEQLMVDLGIEEPDFDDIAMDRMRLGNDLEDAVLNYFEYKLGIKITNRNIKAIDAFDGKLRIKIDGETIFNGEPTIVECKVSNSNYGVFTKNKGYLMQVQAYMAHHDYSQALLLGLWKGQPVWTLIKKDDEMCKDIEAMVDVVFGILNGLYTFEDDFPWELVDKYSNSVKPDIIDDFDEDDLSLAEEYLTLNEEVNGMSKRLELIKDAFKEKYSNVVYKGDTLNFRVSESTRKGFLNETLLELENPDLDLDKYRNEPTVSKRITITKAKR